MNKFNKIYKNIIKLDKQDSENKENCKCPNCSKIVPKDDYCTLCGYDLRQKVLYDDLFTKELIGSLNGTAYAYYVYNIVNKNIVNDYIKIPLSKQLSTIISDLKVDKVVLDFLETLYNTLTRWKDKAKNMILQNGLFYFVNNVIQDLENRYYKRILRHAVEKNK